MINKAMFIGNLVADPEVKERITSFRIAMSESWTDREGNKNERTEFVNIATFGKLAEICGKYLSKGRQVYVEGRVQTDSYDKDGEKRYSTKVVANTVQFLGGNNDEESF